MSLNASHLTFDWRILFLYFNVYLLTSPHYKYLLIFSLVRIVAFLVFDVQRRFSISDSQYQYLSVTYKYLAVGFVMKSSMFMKCVYSEIIFAFFVK